MKIITQLIIILGIWAIGEIISSILPIPMPGSVIGMIILLILLETKLLKLKQIEDVSNYMLENMGLFFIPPGVGLIVSFKLLEGSFVGFFVTCFLTTIIVMGVSGITIQSLLNRKENNG